MEQRVIAKVDTTDDMTRLELSLLAGAERLARHEGSRRLEIGHKGTSVTYHDLLGLSKVVTRVPVELHLAQRSDGNVFLRDNLGRVEEVEAKAQLVFFFHDLDTKLCREDVSIGWLDSLGRNDSRLTSHSG